MIRPKICSHGMVTSLEKYIQNLIRGLTGINYTKLKRTPSQYETVQTKDAYRTKVRREVPFIYGKKHKKNHKQADGKNLRIVEGQFSGKRWWRDVGTET